jgi:hypothetical protein
MFKPDWTNHAKAAPSKRNDAVEISFRGKRRPDEHQPTETWSAMIACVSDLGRQGHWRIPHLARPRTALIAFVSARLRSIRHDA